MRRAVMLVALAGCGAGAPSYAPPSRGGPFARVDKLDGYFREMYLDDRGLAVLAADAPITDFAVTLVTYTNGKEDSIFVRDYRSGVWWSSSPTPHTVVYGEPRVDPDCNSCHAEHAEMHGMFTLFAAREAIARDATAYLECLEGPVTPCDVATYRDLRWR